MTDEHLSRFPAELQTVLSGPSAIHPDLLFGRDALRVFASRDSGAPAAPLSRSNAVRNLIRCVTRAARNHLLGTFPLPGTPGWRTHLTSIQRGMIDDSDVMSLLSIARTPARYAMPFPESTAVQFRRCLA